ncbi:LacI family transcriptional regulator [Catenuloplanes nepalensis]|uniref:LacI family transcriptional regulator n=1 Tax=Catenuloplanes nepalensis TaxID=587533 RepID=A0ABT9MNI5_9ACTN|nr:LacI family DNA-binding transcriptional regulator [Catenuloplanes nepalensis]MDP9793013.1 LacI family transcriptional regulator [Catenuloplanes nepalensis]
MGAQRRKQEENAAGQGTDPGENGRSATIRDVAVRAGVSAATVSRVLADNYPVAPKTRQRVLRAVQELNFVVNTHARALAGVRTETVAFVLHDVRGPSFTEAAYGVEREANRRGRLCLICSTEGDQERELAFVKLMREQRASAVILIGGVRDDEQYRARYTEIAHSLHAAGSRLVLCGRPPLGPDVPATVVEYDNEGGAYAITTHLLANGHRRILYLGGALTHTTSQARLAGYHRALDDFGVEPDPSLIEHGEFTRNSGYERTRARLAKSGARPFTAIFAETDMVAAGALTALDEGGVAVPGEISLVGYDDIELAGDLRPRLTTVHVPYEEMGRTAVRLALDLKEGRSRAADQHVVLGTHVVVRQSVGRRRPG